MSPEAKADVTMQIKGIRAEGQPASSGANQADKNAPRKKPPSTNMEGARKAIQEDRFKEYEEEILAKYGDERGF